MSMDARRGFLFEMTRVFVLLSMFLVSGCASMLSADRQYLEVDTFDVEGARCSVVDDRARQWVVPQTPGRIIIDRGATSLTITCSREGYETALRQVDGNYSALLALNAWPFLSTFAISNNELYTWLLQGGLTILGVGADIAQGRHVTLPQKVSIPMIRPLTPIEQGNPGPLSPKTVLPGEESQRVLELEREIPLSPYDELIEDN